ncbi:MAG: CehA/McbA family metallohydrolase [Vicinamibacterales bacterium]
MSSHGSEARYVEIVPWVKARIAHTWAMSYTELGIGASRAIVQMRTVADRQCAAGAVLAFDVDDRYAFDIDEPVSVTLTYAPAYSKPFTIYWDANGGEGLGRLPVEIEPGAPLRRVTVVLDRARFAGQGTRGVDLAVGAPGGALALCDIEVTRPGGTASAPRPAGRIQLEVRDAASGAVVPARVGLYDSSGRLPLPSPSAVLVHRFTDEVRRLWVSPRAFWPSANRQAFYVSGRYDAELPAGTYEVVVTRGIEYRAHRSSVEIRPGRATRVAVDLQRHVDLPARGWYSADGHMHIGRDVVADEAAWTHAAAEDVHLSNLVQMGNLSRTHFHQPEWGRAGQYEKHGYVILSGQEDPRTVQRGHTLHHNLQAPVHLPTDNYYAYDQAFGEVRRQGGFSGYAHQGELFNGRRGLALDVPFGIVDFIEVLQNGRLSTEGWYNFLNLGFKILPDAGSDFPYMDLPGVVRNYAKIEGPFSAEAWFAAFKRGHMYVTNGPLLEFTVNGRPMGAELTVDRGTTLDVVAEADLNPDIDALSHVELVAHGEVIATEPANGRSRVSLRASVPADRSKWLAFRAWGRRQERANMTVAHSAPVYVLVDGQSFWKPESVSTIVAEQEARLDELMTADVDPRGDLEPWETLALMPQEWERQRLVLKARVDEASSRYQRLRDRAAASSAAPIRPMAAVALLIGSGMVLIVARRRGVPRTPDTAPRD